MTMTNMSAKQKRDKNLYGAVRPVLLVFRFSGLLPIKGLRRNKSEDLGFSWTSLYFLAITVPITFGLMVSGILFVAGCINDKMVVTKYIDLGLWVSSVLAPILCINFSRNFKKMINEIELIESSLPAVKNHGAIIKKIYVILGCYITVCVLDLLLQLYNAIAAMFDPCHLMSQPAETGLRPYLLISERCIYSTVTFSYTLTFMLQFRKIIIICTWNMGAALVLSCSVYLEHRLKDFNQRFFIKTAKDTGSRVNWTEIQAYYTKLCNLVRLVDRYLTPITSITFFTNMYLICQRFFILIGLHHTIGYTHGQGCNRNNTFFIVVTVVLAAMLVTKTLIMMFFIARVHTTSRKPLEVLGTMPSTIYTVEAQRFMEQVYHSKVALSGLEMFYFTKETILTVCGVIVTYELMLFQM